MLPHAGVNPLIPGAECNIFPVWVDKILFNELKLIELLKLLKSVSSPES